MVKNKKWVVLKVTGHVKKTVSQNFDGPKDILRLL